MGGSGWATGPNRRAAALAMVLTLSFGPVRAVPLPVPRPASVSDIAEPGTLPGHLPSAVPLPAPRPEENGPPAPPVSAEPRAAFGPPLPSVPLAPPLPPVPPAPAPLPAPLPPLPEPDLACADLLAGGKVVARPQPTVSGADGCGIATPVMLDAVVLKSGLKVPLTPPPLIRCDLAVQLADWLRDDVATATLDDGDLLGVADAAGYVCRTRDWIAGARLSEHARGNAVDIVGFRFTKRAIALKQADAHAFWTSLKISACARFSTVLGPGSDGFHEDNLHLDLERRHSGFRLCHWDVP